MQAGRLCYFPIHFGLMATHGSLGGPPKPARVMQAILVPAPMFRINPPE